MLELKRIAKDAIPEALEKALRYRLLNEPHEAESICRDILDVDAENQEALITLLLSLTDQFPEQFADAHREASDVVPRLQGDYAQAYYEGIIHERWGKAQDARAMPDEFILGWIRKAMHCYEQAAELDPQDPDPVLRWNTCLRFLERRQHALADPQSAQRDISAEFGDDMPLR